MPVGESFFRPRADTQNAGKAVAMQAPLREKNDIKIFILYLLRNINQPMDYADINDIAG